MASYIGGVYQGGVTDERGGAAPGQYGQLPGPPSSYMPDDSVSPDPGDHTDDFGNVPVVPPGLPPWLFERPPPMPAFPEVPKNQGPGNMPGPSWTPPKLGPWQPPTVPAPDITPGDRVLPWLPPATTEVPDPGVDLWPGAGSPPDLSIPFDIAAILPLMIIMMIVKR